MGLIADVQQSTDDQETLQNAGVTSNDLAFGLGMDTGGGM